MAMGRKLSGEEKCATLLRALGADAAADVMRHLDPADVRKIGGFMAAVEKISKEEEQTVIADFTKASQSGDIGFQGKEYLKSVLTKALGPQKAAQVLDTLTDASYPGLESLKWADARKVAELISCEHPQTAAVVLAHLDPDQGGQVMAALPQSMQSDVALRLATMQEIQPEVLKHLSDALQELLTAATGSKATTLGGPKFMADLMARLDKATESGIMTTLTEKNPTLAETIRSLMFVFDDLVKVDDRGMQEILKETSKEDLTLSMRAGSPEVRDKIFKNMSSRAAQMLKDDLEAGGPVKVSDVEKAQQNILKVCRKLEEEGRIAIGGKGEALV
jgi:flagellar motor switch protein FliG